MILKNKLVFLLLFTFLASSLPAMEKETWSEWLLGKKVLKGSTAESYLELLPLDLQKEMIAFLSTQGNKISAVRNFLKANESHSKELLTHAVSVLAKDHNDKKMYIALGLRSLPAIQSTLANIHSFQELLEVAKPIAKIFGAAGFFVLIIIFYKDLKIQIPGHVDYKNVTLSYIFAQDYLIEHVCKYPQHYADKTISIDHGWICTYIKAQHPPREKNIPIKLLFLIGYVFSFASLMNDIKSL